jgi:hypothetical protein
MPTVKTSIIRTIMKGPRDDGGKEQQGNFLSVAELIQNHAGDSVDIDIFKLIPS